MSKIVMTQSSWGMWTGKVIDGWSVEHEVHSLDREEVLLKLLALMDVKVTYEGEHWVDGTPVPWKQENM